MRSLLRRFREVIPLVLVLAGLCPVMRAQARFAMAHGKTTTTLPFELIDNRVFVEARINGRGSFHLLLDTGASGFSLVGDAVQRLGLQVEDAGQGSGVGENTIRAGRTRIAKVEIGDLQFEEFEAAVFPGGDSGNVFGKKPVDGIVGLALFRHVVVKHDYIHLC